MLRPPPIATALLVFVVVADADASAGALGERANVARTATRNGSTTCDFCSMARATEAASVSAPADENDDDNDDDNACADFGSSTGAACMRATCGAGLTKSGRGFLGSKTARYGSAGSDGGGGGDVADVGFAAGSANNFPTGGVTDDLTCMRCILDGDDTMPARRNQSPECSDIDGTVRKHAPELGCKTDE